MNRIHVKLIPTVLVCLLLSMATAGQVVDESTSTVTINGTNANFELAIAHQSTPTVAPLRLQLIDTEGAVRAEVSQQVQVRTGKQRLSIALPVGTLSERLGDDLGWFRVRYTIGQHSGIASMSELMKDIFKLRLSAIDRVVPGSEFRMRIRAINPFTNASVKGVAVESKLTLELDTDSDEDELELTAKGLSNGDGIAILKFTIPPGIRLDDDPKFEITGRRNGFVEKIEDEFDSDDQYFEKLGYFTTDKPVYQPGEMFNLRGLFLDANNTVVSGKEIELSIDDEDGTELFEKSVTTSDYGVAMMSWKIPASAKLGKYVVELDGTERLTFQVTRYDLPNFVVTTETDKGFYLPPDRRASVTIGADYLFGKPVSSGKVRLVRERLRRWNFEDQKYEIEENGEALTGSTDASGKFVASIDLSRDLEELMKFEWQRYEDLHYTAYFTDTSTNRTEQKRFDIRISKEPIHVYLIYYAEQHPGLPMLGYISTFYPDGTPVETSVDIRVKNKIVDSFRTTRDGAARVKFRMPESALLSRKLDLNVVARDKRGQTGSFAETFSLNEGKEAIQLETDKAIYGAGDAIDLRLTSTKEMGLVYVDLIKDHVVLESRHVNLDKGKAVLRVPYNPRFRGEVVLAAYSDEQRSYDRPQVQFARGVMFPERQGLRLDAKFDRKTYRPGEGASLTFAVGNSTGRSMESVLGITMFDKAIEERAKTNGDFGNYFGDLSKILGFDRTFGSLTLRDLNEIDTSRPISDETQLAAEVILAGSYSNHRARVFQSEYDADDARSAYSDFFDKQAVPAEKALLAKFETDGTYPRDSQSLVDTLRSSGLDPKEFEDPWGSAYTPTYDVDRSHLVVRLSSPGPDERVGTPDDFVVLTTRLPYFAKMAAAIDAAVTSDFTETGHHIRDEAGLISVLKKHGIDLGYLVDPWKRAYRVSFEVSNRYNVIDISSLGPDGVKAERRWQGDDFDVANIYTDYFHGTETQINKILGRALLVSSGKTFPNTIDQFKSSLREGGLDVDTIRDGVGSPVYVTLDSRLEATPVFSIRGKGSNLTDASDDLNLATFSKASAAYVEGAGGSAELKTIDIASAKGAIRGTVADAMGAVVPGAEVVAVSADDPNVRFAAFTNSEGYFLIPNVPSGEYTVTVMYPHFRNFRQDGIVVRSQKLVEMKVTLSAGYISEVVTVTAAPSSDVLNTATSVSHTIVKSASKITFPYGEQVATPRVREYFPETLLWQPELITDRRGRAELNFKMADNITTWKMYAVASTKNGKVAVAEKEVTSFQAFFVDLDPPKFLTEGDRISLPVQVRNYTEEKKAVEVVMARANWFSLTGLERQTIAVEPGRSENAIFGFSADSAVEGGKQRVTATAKKDGDAIEKPVTVRPNGQEVVRTESKLFTGNETFRLEFPSNALAGTPRAEVKIYPDLYAHVGESVEGLLQRPYGCGEQTISSTYPNVMILKFLKKETPLRRKAQSYLEKGYARLLGYQVADGGFSYWGGKDASSYSLTSYALRFLRDAGEFVDVDESAVRRAEDYLAGKQNADGSWSEIYSYANSDVSRRAMTTAYLARTMALRKSGEKNSSLQKAVEYLEMHRSEIDSSYTLALFGLALLDLGEVGRARAIAEQLQKTGLNVNKATHWELAGSTPFYGRGLSGRIETTALVTQLLTRTLGTEAAWGGLLYLLQSKDRYGVWYSTQTTINVLDALIAVTNAKGASASQTVQVLLGGEVIQTITPDPANAVPILLNLRSGLSQNGNLLEIRGNNGMPLMASVVSTHYISWRDATENEQSDLKLAYKCDRTEAAIMDEIKCTVESSRASRYYSMALGEIGLPPGAAVDRESLDRAVTDQVINRYDILPDRLVVYFWTRSGSGTKFNFSFRPRYGIEAQTPASVVYDYYNPESQAIVRPLKFTVK